MGPAASADLYMKLIRMTDAKSDADHPCVLIDSNTRIPDRTAAILAGGESPEAELVRSAKRLCDAGADVLLMACNTAHYWYGAVAEASKVPVINMPEEVAREAASRAYRCVGLLSTSGIIAANVYTDAFRAFAPKCELLLPTEREQKELMHLIYDGVKAGREDYPADGLISAVDGLSASGAQAFVLGCTEMPIAFARYKIQEAALDSTFIAARAALIFAGAKLRENE